MGSWLRTSFALAAAIAVGCSSSNGAERAEAIEGTLGWTVGVNTHYASGGSVDREALKMLADAGVTFIRNDVSWESVENERGVYDFAGAGFDELVQICESLGMRIQFILDYGNALYGEERSVVDDAGRAAFAAFAGAAAERYGGRGHVWEIWNEPNILQFWSSADGGPDPDLYSELVRETVPVLRAADPDGEVILGALFFGLHELTEATGSGIAGPRFLQAVADTGALSLADEVSIHLYRPEPPEGAKDDIARARDILTGAGVGSMPVSSGEWGYSTYDPFAPPTGLNFIPAVSEERQASYLARIYLFNFGDGVRRSVIFKDVDARDPDPGEIEHHWGLMSGELEPKPSYFAVRTLIGLVGDATPSGVFMLGEGEHMSTFERRGGMNVAALWAEQAVTWRLAPQPNAGDVRVISRDGDDVTPEGIADGVQITVDSDDGPIYVLGNVLVSSVK